MKSISTLENDITKDKPYRKIVKNYNKKQKKHEHNHTNVPKSKSKSRSERRRKRHKNKHAHLSSKMNARLKRFDKHHIGAAKRFVLDKGIFVNANIIQNVSDINKICANCMHCVQTVAHCMHFDTPVYSDSFIGSCTFQAPIQ